MADIESPAGGDRPRQINLSQGLQGCCRCDRLDFRQKPDSCRYCKIESFFNFADRRKLTVRHKKLGFYFYFLLRFAAT
jgi:hypothetical protein